MGFRTWAGRTLSVRSESTQERNFRGAIHVE